MREQRIIGSVAAVAMLAAGMSAGVLVGTAHAVDEIEVTVLSGRPDTVSGGDALLRIDVPADVELSDVRVAVNGMDATAAFRADADGHRLAGVVDGLSQGANEVTVSVAGDAAGAALELVNHPVEGPVFSGPHEQPFVCETDAFELPSGETLGAPLDENCSVARRVDYAYRAADGALKPLADPAALPADVATTTTLTGAEVPYVVRIETGTINRAVYQIAMLHAPGAGNPDPDAWTASPGWNRRLIYTFGGGCVNGWYRQGARTGGVTDDVMLSRGYAVASASLNVYGNNCNDLLAAETMMLVKERFIEAYGPPRYTIGWGCSGGSYQNHQIADNYPGLLDGIIPGCSFPDVGFGTIPMVTDARLLDRYFRETATVSFTDEQQRAVAGFLELATMPNVSRNAGRVHVGEFCPEVLPEHLRYHPTDNPEGARCDVYSHYVNVYGRDAETGFARRPLDNTGVQYGLAALNDGVITPEQFLDLNRRIGGYDPDGRFQAERTAADAEAIRLAYETGRLTSGGGGLAETPIIDYRAYSDDRENGDVHVRYHSFSMRERLRKANGRTDNHVMLVEDDRHGLYSSRSPVLRGALAQMDRWLASLAADASSDPRVERVARARPADLVDACWSRDDDPVRIVEEQMRGSGRCDELYPSPPGPREVAGAPVASDVIKCRTKPVDPADYAARFTAEEEAELREVFAGGVCDWTRPGVGQTGLRGTWLSFGER
ncbi:MAG: DUF6351 family protein [Acidobacteria bacterium]|nr:DUF6351 family protein [Acidobacteriota bacterium]